MQKKLKILLVLTLIVAGLMLIFQPGEWLTLESVKAARANLQLAYEQQPLQTALIYLAIYIAVTALSIPGATVMTLAGGFIFGLKTGLVLVLFGATIGATLAFLVSRYLFRDWMTERFSSQLKAINKGIDEEGGFYLFALRLVPLFPFFMINLLFGLTHMPVWRYAWVSWIGMMAGTLVFVNAGTHLADIEQISDIFTADLVLAFALLGVLPLISRHLLGYLRKGRVYKGWEKPTKFDYNLVVIGAGAAGLVAAYTGASMRARVALIERERMGGDCLNTGCVPSKALLHLANLRAKAQQASEMGLANGVALPRLEQLMDKVVEAIEKVEPHDSPERYESLGVEVISGDAKLQSPWTVSVGDRVLTTRNIILATGAKPWVPPIPGLEDIPYLTTDSIWSLSQLPSHLTVMGGGAVGCELAQAFARLGSSVTLIDAAPRIMPTSDPDVSAAAVALLEKAGVNILTGCLPVSIRGGDDAVMFCQRDGDEIVIPLDQLLVAVGRRPDTEGLGIEKLSLQLTDRGHLAVNQRLATRFPNIYACGDVTEGYQLTHAAGNQGWIAAANALARGIWQFKSNEEIVPQVLYTDPEIATVGMTEQALMDSGKAYESTVYPLDDLDRAIADGVDSGFVKILTAKGGDSILGAAIVAPRAGEMIMEYVLAMRHKLGLRKLLATIRPYPSYADAGKLAAGAWQREHLPEKLMNWLARWNRFRL